MSQVSSTSTARPLSIGTKLFIGSLSVMGIFMLLVFLCLVLTLAVFTVRNRQETPVATPTPTITLTPDPTTAALAATVAALTTTLTPTIPLASPTPALYPASCAAVRQQDPQATDGEYTIYLGGQPERPFSIYCHNMESRPAEYLTLFNINDGFNYSLISYPEGAIVTHYQKLRLQPSSLTIDRTDRAFATTQQQTPGYFPLLADVLLNYPVTAVDYAWAESCNRGDTSTPPGRANIDLTGTAFVLNENWEFAYLGGSPQDPAIEVSPDRRVVNLSINGRCAHIQPVGELVLSYIVSE